MKLITCTGVLLLNWLSFVGVEGKRRVRVVGGDQSKPPVTGEGIRDQAPQLMGGEEVVADEGEDKPQ